MGTGSATLGSALVPGDLHTLWITFVCGSGILLCGGVHNLLINAFYRKRNRASGEDRDADTRRWGWP